MTENRKSLLSEAISIAIAATLANFIWQACFDQNWLEALKVSYFQTFSVLYLAWKAS